MFPVVILCGGYAKRMSPLTDTIPKSLIDINGKPFLYHQLEWLTLQGVQEIHLCTGHYGNQIAASIAEYNSTHEHIPFIYMWPDGPTPIGTAEALRRVPMIRSTPFFVLYGDVFALTPLYIVQHKFEAYEPYALMVIYESWLYNKQANVDYYPPRIVKYNKFNQEPQMIHGDYGLSILTQQALAASASTDLADVFAALNNEMIGFPVTGKPYEIGSFSGLARTREFLQ